ncbi:MAG: hypothetical protein DI640_13060 [Sphingomonas taxi]|uniref:Uncharacterized protein n=1 Tax=Sphingomonas taxi TaxID=1549858 RepID=A0A2W4YT93_9SPHN|nr:MAG: hypothetical protein DI640_13060 [Sphingomonas taxi]
MSKVLPYKGGTTHQHTNNLEKPTMLVLTFEQENERVKIKFETDTFEVSSYDTLHFKSARLGYEISIDDVQLLDAEYGASIVCHAKQGGVTRIELQNVKLYDVVTLFDANMQLVIRRSTIGRAVTFKAGGAFKALKTINMYDAIVGQTSEIAGGTVLDGCVIGEGCTVEASVGKNNRIMDGATVVDEMEDKDEELLIDPDFIRALAGLE